MLLRLSGVHHHGTGIHLDLLVEGTPRVVAQVLVVFVVRRHSGDVVGDVSVLVAKRKVDCDTGNWGSICS